MLVAIITGVTGLAGCGNSPDSVLNSTVTGLKAGIYNGSVNCVVTQWVGGVMVSQDYATWQRAVTVDDSGMPTKNGQPVAVGTTSTIAFGDVSGAGQVTNVIVSSNGVVVSQDVYLTLPGICLDTCQYAYDGECDDGGPGAVTSVCLYGTDCWDCGQIPQELAGDVTQTLKDGSGDGIDYTESWVAAFSTEFFSGTGTVECSGTLAQ